jgi:hypothetical protein
LGYWGNSDSGGVQDIAWEQLVREMADQTSMVLSPNLGRAANQSSGLLYTEIRSELGRGLNRPTIGKNLSVFLEERIAKELNVSNCWVCRGAFMSEEWPWKGTGLNAYQLLLWNQSITRQENNQPQTWILTSEVIGGRM